jgi:hypothetical protein
MVGVIDGDTVSLGVGDGDGFFLRRGDGLGVAATEDFFLSTRGVADGLGDSFSGTGEDFFFGEGLGKGDALVPERFFFRGVGVGVGVEKIFLSVSANDDSAACTGATVEAATAITRRTRISITTVLTGYCCAFLKVDFGLY